MAELMFAGVREVPIDSLRPSPENDEIYGPVDPHDPAFIALVASIARDGVREPLIVTMDSYIVSGHRRHAAAKTAGLVTMPVLVLDIFRADDRNAFVAALREHNRQRVKTLGQQVREAIIDADPEECRAELEAHRQAEAEVGHVPLVVGERRRRKRISGAKAPFEAAIGRVLEGLRAFWPISDRQIHYGLLNDPPLRHASKPGSRYRNDRASYKALVELLTRMRLVGTIPFDAIGDETRPVIAWHTHREPGTFLSKEIDAFLKHYSRDLQQSQPHHVELVVEKNTVTSIVRPVAARFRLPMTSGRGYCSLPPRYAMAERFRRSGKAKLVVLLVSDFDPDGEAIAETFARSMRDDFHVRAIHPVKVALTRAQIDEHRLPPSMEAKTTSSRTEGFVAQHGRHVWELEALAPVTLQEIVRNAVVSVTDMRRLAQEEERETADATKLHAIRETVRDALRDLRLDEAP